MSASALHLLRYGAGLLFVWLIGVVGWPATATGAGTETAQTIELNAGWNLISLQVDATPSGFTPQQIQQGITNQTLQSLWTYDPLQGWLTYQPQLAGFPHSLTRVFPGKGYWLQVSGAGTLTLTGALWNGAIDFQPGWNLVGFPGDPAAMDDLALAVGMDWASVFGDQLDRIGQIWTYEGGAQNRFIGYDPLARPAILELQAARSGAAYWVRTEHALTLSSVPEILLPQDIDVPPLQQPVTNGLVVLRPVGPEDTEADTDLNRNGYLDDPVTQDTLIFREGIDRQLVTIVNSGHGIASWQALENIDWLHFFADADANPPVRTNSLNGIVSSASAFISVAVDRTGLLTGTYSNSFVIYAGSTQKVVTAILKVPSARGDYRGFATTTRVNGKSIAMGKVDMAISLFAKSTNVSETAFQAVIGSERSLLFPRDVFMNGQFFLGQQFFLTTSFEVPPGDRNAPPFNTFIHKTSDKIDPDFDLDWNLNKRLDNDNPFHFALRREVTLVGTRVTENRLVGEYYETLANVLALGPPIMIEGSFELNRETLEPSLTTIHNLLIVTNQSIGGSGVTSFVSAGRVPRAVTVQGVSLVVDGDFPAQGGFRLSLQSPQGTNLVLQSLTNGSSGRIDFSTVLSNQFNGQLGRGDWNLRVDWTGAQKGRLTGWELKVAGLSAFAATGRVVTVSGGSTNPVEGAHILLAGNNVIEQRLTAADGAFSFTNLTENDFVLTISKPGHHTVNVDFTIRDEDVALGSIVLPPVAAVQLEVQAFPVIGGQPLTVTLVPTIPQLVLDALGPNPSFRWEFGNGVQLNVQDPRTYVTYAYTNAGAFTPRLVLEAMGNPPIEIPGPGVTVLPQAPYPNQPTNLFAIGFIGSIASRIESEGDAIEVHDASGLSGIVYQETKRDVASFDINREPASYDPTREDSEFFAQPLTFWAKSNNVDGPDNQFDAINLPGRVRMICTMGGFVFGELPSRSGNAVLQTSRLED